jgi:hypothetical protein
MVLARSKIEELEIISACLEDVFSMARARTGEWQENEALRAATNDALRAALMAVEAVQGSLKQKEELLLREQDKEMALSLELMERIKQAEAEAEQGKALVCVECLFSRSPSRSRDHPQGPETHT